MVSELTITLYCKLIIVVLGIELRDDSAPSHGLDFLPADAERLAMRFKEKAASSDAAWFSGILEESIEQALLQPTIDDYEIHMVPLHLVSTRVYHQGLLH